MANRSVHRLAMATVVAMLVLLAAGALVNSYQAAGSVPDWPLSYGELIPHVWTGNAAYEQAHRLIVVVVLVLVLWLAFALRREERRSVRRLGFWAAGLYLLQVLLGGGLVLMHAPHWLGAIHTFLGQIVFVLVFLVMLAASPRRRQPDAGAGGEELPSKLVVSIAHLAALQVALGAILRHPPFGQTVFIVTLLTHIAVALALLVMIAMAVMMLSRSEAPKRMRGLAYALLALIILQWAVGLPLFFFSPEPLDESWPPPPGFPHMHATHVVLAALILAHASALALLARRRSQAGGPG